MRKKVIGILMWLLASACSTPAQRTAESGSYRSKYPYTVLGEDYGLLTENDVAINSCIAHPSPFSFDGLSSHPYWQCFSLKGSAFECENADFNEEGQTAILAIVLKKDGAFHEYLSRRAIPVGACQAYRDSWVRLTSGQAHVCISGEFISESDEKSHRSWVLEAYRTSKGCDSYFEGGCDLAFQLRRGCDIAEMSQPVFGDGE